MANNVRIGQAVTIRNATYIVTDIVNCSASGPKFFGKFRYILRDSNGNVFSAFGKNLTANSRLTAR